ncbi:hypothetical protein [Xanthocytophaga flava]|uniref:hypothetical protein n=1 Tax=Xanthocytophaga flava TaxID=3048013 RepID=UPI0028D1DDE3|nr:hypothetical protein [Xanthocytophaga flavus]MDJ1473702.1 hypothetical protein [Xanthocytophaga flavus]
MIKKLFLLFTLITALVTAFSPVKAQHCGFDHAFAIIVDVRDSISGQIIDGLEVFFADSVGIPYKSEWNLIRETTLTIYQKTELFKFGQNQQKGPQSLFEPLTSFPFAINHYMKTLGSDYDFKQSDLILIKDTDGEMNGGYYGTHKVKFKDKNIVSLCKSQQIWQSTEAVNKIKILVTLNPAK